MKISAVIFDLDGTIADTLPLCIKAFRAAIEPLIQRSLSDDEIIATFGPSEEGTIMALAPASYEEGVASYLRHYAGMHDMCPAPFEGIREILTALQIKNIPVAMVTGKGEHSTAISLDHFSLAHYFTAIETGSPLGPRKAAGIQAVLDTWPAIDRKEVIYVGDAPSDITASRAAGIPVVAAAWAETTDVDALAAMKPDALFTTVAAFGDWLADHTGYDK